MSEKLEDKLTTLVHLAFDAYLQAATLGIDYETARYIFAAYNLLIAAGTDQQGNKRTFN